MLKTVIFSSSVMLLAMAATVQAESPSPVERLTLQTDALRVEVTPDIGGRVLHISRPGKPNILRIGKAVEEIQTRMSAAPAVTSVISDMKCGSDRKAPGGPSRR